MSDIVGNKELSITSSSIALTVLPIFFPTSSKYDLEFSKSFLLDAKDFPTPLDLITFPITSGIFLAILGCCKRSFSTSKSLKPPNFMAL